ncbi:MAG: hypothetical protein ACFFDT_04780 [Candidatus Hodarchaeota archaeon]
MNKFILCLLVLMPLSTLVHGQEKKAQDEQIVVAKYDRFKESTTITLSDQRMQRFLKICNLRPYLIASISFKGKVPTDNAPAVELVLVSVNEDWMYIRDHKLYALLDDKPMTMPETTHDGQTWSGGDVFESVYFVLAWDKFVRLCNAHKVEFKLGIKEFELAPVELKALRQVREKYKEMLKDGKEEPKPPKALASLD